MGDWNGRQVQVNGMGDWNGRLVVLNGMETAAIETMEAVCFMSILEPVKTCARLSRCLTCHDAIRSPQASKHPVNGTKTTAFCRHIAALWSWRGQGKK